VFGGESKALSSFSDFLRAENPDEAVILALVKQFLPSMGCLAAPIGFQEEVRAD